MWINSLLLIAFVIFTAHCLLRGVEAAANRRKSSVELVFKWKHAEIHNLPDRDDENEVDGQPNYTPENNIIYGIARDVVNDVIYAAIPRNAPGVPSSLVVLHNVSNSRELSPAFEAFASHELNQLKSCDLNHKGHHHRRRKGSNYKRNHINNKKASKYDYSFDSRYDTRNELKQQRFPPPPCNTMERIISTYEPVLDKCGRLWILDTGVLEYNSGNVVVKRPQLWTFNVQNGPEYAELERRFNFPVDVVPDGTGLSGLAVDIVNDNCEETFAYIPNQIDNQIVVYDYFKDRTWYLDHYSFRGDATESQFTHDGYKSYFKAGVSSITLGREESGHFRRVYYTAGSSTGEYSISSRDLRFPGGKDQEANDVALFGYRGANSQAMVHVFDEKSGVLFFAESQSGRVRCWNSQKPLRPENLITIFESKHFVYGAHISIDHLDNLWFLSNSFPLFKADLYEDAPHSSIRLYTTPVSKAIADTECEMPPKKRIVTLTKENIKKFFNISITEVITDDLLK